MSKKQPQLSLDRENLDAQLEAAAQKRKKQKRKKIVIRVIIIAIILVIAIAIIGAVVGIMAAGKTKEKIVEVTHPSTEEITQEVKINGTVQSDNVQHFFSPSSIKVEKVVPVGTFVKKGDPIITFDKDSYEEALREVEIGDKIAANKNSSQSVSDGQLYNKLAEAKADVQKYEDEIKKNQEKVDSYEKDDALDTFASNVSNQVMLCEVEINRLQMLQKGETDPDKIAEYGRLITEQENIISNVKKQLSDSQTDYTKNKNDLESNKLKLDSAKATVESYEKQIGNAYDRENVKLQGELSTLKSGSDYEELLKYENGCLIAPFDGIVTASYVSDGMTTPLTTTEMVAFSSIEDVSVAVAVGKKDLKKIQVGQEVKITILDKEYEGVIDNISRVALNSSGGASSVSVVIKIKNPDSNIYLGIEAKNVIITAHEDSCLTLPSEAINVDSEGYFVYTVNDMNMVEKKRVEVGISSESRTQILEGVSEDDQVITYVTANVHEGAVVVPQDTDAMASMLGSGDGMGGIVIETESDTETEEE